MYDTCLCSVWCAPIMTFFSTKYVFSNLLLKKHTILSVNYQKMKRKKLRNYIIMISFRIRIPLDTNQTPEKKSKTLDDLEMDIVAALEAQHLQRENGGVIVENGNIYVNAVDALTQTSTGSANSSPKELRKIDSKKRWKNWSWKYSPGGKQSSIEEEPESPKKTSRHSSPTSSPKHKKSTSSDATPASNMVANFIATSPLRRKNQSSAATSHSAARGDIRSSAGARLCQALDDGQDGSGDELQALLINGRPASVHIVPMSSSSSSPSTKPLINNEV